MSLSESDPTRFRFRRVIRTPARRTERNVRKRSKHKKKATTANRIEKPRLFFCANDSSPFAVSKYARARMRPLRRYARIPSGKKNVTTLRGNRASGQCRCINMTSRQRQIPAPGCRFAAAAPRVCMKIR